MRGRVRLGKRTKELAPLLKPQEIAIICHEDLDAVGAAGLLDGGVCAVINCKSSLTCRYPNLGPKLLLEHGILLLDDVGDAIFDLLKDGDIVEIQGRKVLHEGEIIAVGTLITSYLVEERTKLAKLNLPRQLDSFVTNTLLYATKEKDQILGDLPFPPLHREIKGKQTVVVVRGLGYREDLQILTPFIQEQRPILIGVDGGADALISFGYRPQIIVGDMDSVSDEALLSGAQVLAHGYLDGCCPSASRLQQLGIEYDVVPAPGTSEDLALLLAHHYGAELIVLVGSHSNMIDFLEKGRPGMASTFLTRLKIGPILLDAKKVSELYQTGTAFSVLPIVFAAFVPIFVFLSLASPWRHYFRLLWLQLRVIVGWL